MRLDGARSGFVPGFGTVTAKERNRADQFLASLVGGTAIGMTTAFPLYEEDDPVVTGRSAGEWIREAHRRFLGNLPPRSHRHGARPVLKSVMEPADKSWRSTTSRKTRDEILVAEIEAGNIPGFLRRGRIVSVEFKTKDGQSHWIKYQVMPDYLAVGNTNNHMVVPLTAPAAQKIADAFGCILPTAKMVDQIYAKAAVKLPAQGRSYSKDGYDPATDTKLVTHKFDEHLKKRDRQMSTAAYREHDLAIKAALLDKGVTRERGMPLVAGHKKDLVIARSPNPRGVQFYGFYDSLGHPIQSENGRGMPVNGHTRDGGGDPLFVDYSHGVRLVAGTMLVDYKEMSAADVLASPLYAPHLSAEGPITSPRVP
jgi:hypothetical protein